MFLIFFFFLQRRRRQRRQQQQRCGPLRRPSWLLQQQHRPRPRQACLRQRPWPRPQSAARSDPRPASPKSSRRFSRQSVRSMLLWQASHSQSVCVPCPLHVASAEPSPAPAAHKPLNPNVHFAPESDRCDTKGRQTTPRLIHASIFRLLAQIHRPGPQNWRLHADRAAAFFRGRQSHQRCLGRNNRETNHDKNDDESSGVRLYC